jgi:hypothetical protein
MAMMNKITRFCAIYLGLLTATLVFFVFVQFPGAFIIAYTSPVHFLCLVGLVFALRRKKNREGYSMFPVVSGIFMFLALLFSAWMWYALTRYFAYG